MNERVNNLHIDTDVQNERAGTKTFPTPSVRKTYLWPKRAHVVSSLHWEYILSSKMYGTLIWSRGSATRLQSIVTSRAKNLSQLVHAPAGRRSAPSCPSQTTLEIKAYI